MTAGEFIQKNSDILTGVVKEADLENLTDGNVLFMLITTPGQKEIKNRVVRSAGYCLVVARATNHLGKVAAITVLGLTAGGYAKIEVINLRDLEYKRNKMVFFCKPLQKNDMRQNYEFLK